MTSLAFILGVLPLVFATGAGQEGRHSVGTAVAGGMLFSTFLNVVFIPVLYVVIETSRAVRAGATAPVASGPRPKSGSSVDDSRDRASATMDGTFSWAELSSS